MAENGNDLYNQAYQREVLRQLNGDGPVVLDTAAILAVLDDLHTAISDALRSIVLSNPEAMKNYLGWKHTPEGQKLDASYRALGRVNEKINRLRGDGLV